ncbi:MAG: hypothetical protein HPY78_10600 [Brevinematales bacterium]|nr:hypothetical protein [Brevinematales bacterium]
MGILTGGATYHYNNGQTNMKLTRWDLENIRLLNEYYNYYNQTRGGRR